MYSIKQSKQHGHLMEMNMWHTYSEPWIRETSFSFLLCCQNDTLKMRTEEQHIVQYVHCTECHMNTDLLRRAGWLVGKWTKRSRIKKNRPNKIVYSQRQLSVNCPTPQAITNCSFRFVLPIIVWRGRGMQEDQQKTGYKNDTLWSRCWCMVQCGVYNYELRNRHRPNLRIGRNWQRKITE